MTDQTITTEASDAPEASAKRRMPENLQSHLVRLQGGKLYLPAAQRIVWMRDECPDWGIETTLIEGGQEAGFAAVRAVVRNAEGRIIATGTKTETKQDFPAGWVEKAETGSIARALAVAGFGTQFMPELDEGPRVADSPQNPAGNGTNAPAVKPGIWSGPGQCPSCHAPESKTHASGCKQVASLIDTPAPAPANVGPGH